MSMASTACRVTGRTFDLLHVGRVRLLGRLRQHGDRLVVGRSTDQFNRIKGEHVTMPCTQRRGILPACRFVDDVFPRTTGSKKREDIIRLLWSRQARYSMELRLRRTGINLHYVLGMVPASTGTKDLGGGALLRAKRATDGIDY